MITALHIEWSDGVTHDLTWRLLRKGCPCATCREERGGPAIAEVVVQLPRCPHLSPHLRAELLPVITPQEARPLKVARMQPVGNYAYGIDFTDGHTTGIYTLDYLRELGEASQGLRTLYLTLNITKDSLPCHVHTSVPIQRLLLLRVGGNVPAELRDGWELMICGDLSDKQLELTERLVSVPARSRGTIFFDSCGGSAYVGLGLAALIRLRGT